MLAVGATRMGTVVMGGVCMVDHGTVRCMGLGTGAMVGACMEGAYTGGGMYGGGGYGGMYGGYYRGGMGMGMYGPGDGGGLPLPWLQNIFHMVSSLGQVTEMLGMNTEALGYLFSSFMAFLESAGNVLSHVRHGGQITQGQQEEAGVKTEVGR